MISTVFETTPPVWYGGTERVVSLLTEALVARGLNVTLFATGDSQTRAQLCSFYAAPVKPYDLKAELVHYLRALTMIRDMPYDIVHCHTIHHLLVRSTPAIPMITTLHHDPTDIPPDIAAARPDLQFVAVSQRQAANAQQRGMTIVGSVYNAVDTRTFGYGDGQGGYLAFLGRISSKKGTHLAIRVAQQTGMPLKIAGSTPSEADEDYFRREVMTHVDGTHIEFVGELDDINKVRFLQRARALLFPVQWEEPFGIVMIEAMSCGTPVIGMNRGAVPEIVLHGVTGFVVADSAAMSEAVHQIETIERMRCRRHVIETFDVTRMAADYEQLYLRLLMGQ